MPRPEVAIGPSAGPTNYYGGGGTCHIVQATNGALYSFRIGATTALGYYKSTDGGVSWAPFVTVATCTISGAITQFSVWYDRWSGISGDLIHVAVTDSDIDDVRYRSINTASSDALSGTTTIFAGASTSGSTNALSICRARGGNLLCVFDIDGGTEDGCYKSTDVGATWGVAGDPTEGAPDMWLLAPGFAADSQDMMLFFWDVSNNEISRKLYDDSADSWAETSISTGMVEVAQSTAFPNFAFAPDLTNSKNILIAWNGSDVGNDDLKAWSITESAITALTDVVANGTDDQGLCALSIDSYSGKWHAYYCGKSDGSETWNTSLNIYRKISTDSGSTWGSEEKMTANARQSQTLFAPLLSYGEPTVSRLDGVTAGNCQIYALATVRSPRFSSVLGF